MITFKEFLNERVSLIKPIGYNNDPEKIKQLEKAVFKGDLDIIKSLLGEGVNPNATDENGYPLAFELVMRQNREALRLFLDGGFDVHTVYNKDTILSEAIYRREQDKTPISLKIIEDLLDANADINFIARITPLITKPIHSDDVDLLKLMLKYNPDLELRGTSQFTPLMSAVIQDRVDMVELLIKAGADLKAKNRMGASVLDVLRDKPLYKELLSKLKIQ